MLSHIEEVKKILKQLLRDCGHGLTSFSCKRIENDSKQICQLFSQPDYLKLSHEANMRYGIPKSDVDDKDLRKAVREQISLLGVGLMIIIGKLKPEDLVGIDKERYGEVCQAVQDNILALIKPVKLESICPESICDDCLTPGIFTSTACEECWQQKHIISKPQPVKLRRLGDEEIQNIIAEGVIKYSVLGVPKRRQAIDRDIAQAQLELDQRQLTRL